MTRKERYEELDRRANNLLQGIIGANQAKEFANDYHLSSAAEKPSVSLITTLAHCATAEENGYVRRNLGYAKTYIAECQAVLRAAKGVGMLELSYTPLIEQTSTINTLLLEWMGAISTMKD